MDSQERTLEPDLVPPETAASGAGLGAEAQSAPRWQERLIRALLVADALVVTAAVIAAQLILALRVGHGDHTIAIAVSALLVPAWLFTIASAGGYELRFLGTGAEEFKRIGVATVTLTAVVGCGAFVFGVPLSRVYVAMAVPCAGAALLVERYVARVWLHSLRRQGRALHRVVAVGNSREVEHLLSQADSEPSSGWSIVGVCLVGGTEDVRDVPFLSRAASVEDVAAAAHEVGADTIAVLHPRALGPGGIRRLAWQLEGTHTHLLLSPQLTDIAGPRVTIRPLVGLPLLHLEQPAFSGFKQAVKRALDLGVGSVLSVLALPLILLAAVCVVVDSRGPAFFRQTRVGVRGEHFTCWKLRSMQTGADSLVESLSAVNEKADGLLFKIRTDPRVTRVGRVLRRLSIDELPQLLNVLAGQMSLVGPRPPLPTEVARYTGDVGRRLLVKPGMTGLWQVSGRSNLTWEESVRLDLYYVENWSPLLDLSILAKTVIAVAKGSGAY